jgi:hypothetical protein
MDRRQFIAATPAAFLLTGGVAHAAPERGGGKSGGADAQDALNALSRWALGYDSRDVELMDDAFAAETRFVLRPPGGATPLVFEGHAAVMKLFTDSLASQTDRRRHVLTNQYVERVSRKRMRVTSYLVLIVIENGALRVQTTGVYRDVVVRERDGVWRIRERDLTLDLPS